MTHYDYVRLLERSEQLLTAAIASFQDGEDDVFDTLMADATAIADEWAFTQPLRMHLLDCARENVVMQRQLVQEWD